MIELLFAQPVDVPQAIEKMRAAYTVGAAADHLTYETRRDDGTFDVVTAVLRAADAPDGRVLRYETSSFAFHAKTGRLAGSGVGPPEPRRVLVVEQDGRQAADLLTGLVPTGPLPQLWQPDGGEVADPALGAVRFTEVETEGGATLITGASAYGEVRVESDAVTGRLIRMSAVLRDGAIELRASPIEPGDPEAWSIATDRRRIVTRIDQLAPSLAILSRGDLLPDLHLQRADGTGITVADWHESPPEDAPRASWSLILFADATSADPAAALRGAAQRLDAIRQEAASRELEASPAERFWLRYRPLIVLVMPEESAFEARGSWPDAENTELLYSTRPDLTIDRLPLAPFIAVSIDRDRVIGAMSARSDGDWAQLFVEQMLEPASNNDD